MRGFAPILIILLIVAVASIALGGYYLLKPKPAPVQPIYQTPSSPSPVSSTSEPTSSADMVSWKTFNESQYGFSFKYPEIWIRQKDTPFYLISVGPVVHGGGGFNGIRISAPYQNPRGLSLDDLLKQGRIGYADSNYPKWEKTKIAGFESLISRSVPGISAGEEVLISKDKIVLDIYCGDCTDDLFDQILDTFKFLP